MIKLMKKSVQTNDFFSRRLATLQEALSVRSSIGRFVGLSICNDRVEKCRNAHLRHLPSAQILRLFFPSNDFFCREKSPSQSSTF